MTYSRCLGGGLIIVSILIVLAPFAMSQGDQTSQWIQICKGENGAAPDQSIGACTDLLPYANDAQAQGSVYGFRGDAYVRRGDHASAVQDYTQAIRLMPNQPELTPFMYVKRGISYASLQQRDRAIADFRTAINYRSPNVDVTEHARDWLRHLGVNP